MSRRRIPNRALLTRLLAYVIVAVALGVSGAIAWVLLVDLPEYTVEEDGRAFTTQEGITQVFGSDAWFTAIGVVAGIGLGLLAWRWFRTLGWAAPVLAGVAALVSGVTCWQVGNLLGPGSFDERLAQAAAGDVVQIQLDVHAPIVLALWVMTAELPVLIAASLLHDPEDQPHDANGALTSELGPEQAGPPAGEPVTAVSGEAVNPSRTVSITDEFGVDNPKE